MKKQLLLTFILVFSAAIPTLANKSTAKKSTAKLNYQAYWLSTPKVTKTMGHAEVSTQWSQRVLPVRGTLIPVATMTTGEIKSATGEGFPKDFTGGIAELTKIKKWKQENRGSYIAYEAPVPDQGRYIKVFVSKTKDSYKYSIVSVRIAFMLPTYFEAELLQRDHIGDAKGVASLQESANKYAQLYRLLVSPAEAVTEQWILNYLTNWQSVTSGGVNAANNVAGSINNGANAMNTFNANAPGLVSQMTGEVRSLNHTFAEKSDSVVNAIDRATDPTRVGKVAFAAGLGGALGYGLGSLAVQFATDGGVKLGRELFYMITGDLKPEVREQIEARGNKAWASLEELSKKAMALDLEMQVQMTAMYLTTGKDPMSLGDAEREIDRLEDNIRDLEEDKKKNRDSGFRSICNEQIRDMKAQLELLKMAYPVMARYRSEQTKCAAFDQMYERWVAIESQINAARNMILNDTSTLIAAADAHQGQSAKNLGTDRGEKKDCSFKDAISDINSKMSEDGCACGGELTPGTCGKLCQALKNYKDASESCLRTTPVQQKQKLDEASEIERRSNTAKQMAESLERQQNHVLSGNGNFSKMQDGMTAHFQDIMKECGSKTAVSVPESRGRQMAENLMASDAPIASAKADAVPGKKEGPGFFKGLWDGLSNFGRWLTGKS